MMGQPPRIVFRFTHTEVAKMEEVLRDLNAMPKRPVIQGLTDDFNASPDRSGDGKVPVQYNQHAAESIEHLWRSALQGYSRIAPVALNLILGVINNNELPSNLSTKDEEIDLCA